MTDAIRADISTIKSDARKLLSRVHPDRLRSFPEATPLLERLIPLLSRITDNPHDLEHWGDDIDNEYLGQRLKDNAVDPAFPNGNRIDLVGLDKDGKLRKPLAVALKKPSVFMKMLLAYLDTGSIPPELAEEPDYERSVDEEDETSWGPRNRNVESLDAAGELKKSIAEAEDFDHLRAIQVATTVHFKHNMRLQGVLAALDSAVERVILKEIENADSEDAYALIEEHISTFPFDTEESRPRLENALSAHKEQTPDASDFKENPLEIRISGANDLRDLETIARDIANDANLTDEERSYAARSCNTYAKIFLARQCESAQSFQDYGQTLKLAATFPFSNAEYGQDVLDIVENHAKFGALKKIYETRSRQELEAAAIEISRFPFRHEANLTYLRSEIDKKERLMHRP